MSNAKTLDCMVEDLIDVLFDHLEVHGELACLLEDKEQAIVKLDLSAMDDLTEQERALINRISALETKRIDMTRAIGERIGHANPKKLRLSGIIPYVESETGYTLVELRDDLRRLAHKIEKIQDRNRTLLCHSLDHIHVFMSALSGIDPEAKHYSAHGTIQADAHPAVLDRRF